MPSAFDDVRYRKLRGPDMLVMSSSGFDPSRKSVPTSLDHLVCASEHHRRHVEAECLGGLEINRHFKLGWGLNGKLSRLLAFEDAVGIDRRAPIAIQGIASIGQ